MQNAKYKPTPAAIELEAQANEQKRAREAAGLPPLDIMATGVPNAMGGIVEEISRLTGLLPLSPEDVDRIDKELQAEHKADARKLEKASRQAKFERLCPNRFREPWDWKLCKEGIDPKEVYKIWGWTCQPKGLFVYGESGRSKTRAMQVLMRRLVIKEDRDVMFLDGIGFSNLCTRAFGNPDSTEQILAPMLRAEVLVIDDLGKRWTAATEEGAFAVFDRRSARNLPILATLNYTAQDLLGMQELRGELAALRDVATPLIRRMADYCEPVIL